MGVSGVGRLAAGGAVAATLGLWAAMGVLPPPPPLHEGRTRPQICRRMFCGSSVVMNSLRAPQACTQ